MADEEDRARRLRQQAETSGSLAPRHMARALHRSTPPRPRRWADMRRAEKYALVQSQLVMWVLIVVVAYLFATKVSVALAVVDVGVMLGMAAWMPYRIRRSARDR